MVLKLLSLCPKKYLNGPGIAIELAESYGKSLETIFGLARGWILYVLSEL